MKVLMAQTYPSDDVGTDIEPILNVINTQKGNYIYELDYTKNF